MNRLGVHVIFIHIISDQQLSRIFPSNTFTQDHIANLNGRYTLSIPRVKFGFRQSFLCIAHSFHQFILHPFKNRVSNIIVAMSSNSYSGDSRNGGKAVVKSLFHQNMKCVCTTIEHKINISHANN